MFFQQPSNEQRMPRCRPTWLRPLAWTSWKAPPEPTTPVKVYANFFSPVYSFRKMGNIPKIHLRKQKKECVFHSGPLCPAAQRPNRRGPANARTPPFQHSPLRDCRESSVLRSGTRCVHAPLLSAGQWQFVGGISEWSQEARRSIDWLIDWDILEKDVFPSSSARSTESFTTQLNSRRIFWRPSWTVLQIIRWENGILLDMNWGSGFNWARITSKALTKWAISIQWILMRKLTKSRPACLK